MVNVLLVATTCLFYFRPLDQGLMTSFEITNDTCTIGFQTHANLDPYLPIQFQIGGTVLTGYENLDVSQIATIIQKNSSLHVSFGWSFESGVVFDQMMKECIDQMNLKYELYMGKMTTDLRCSWIGFIPFNTFEKDMYSQLSKDELTEFNNELVAFQTDVITFISKHPIFLQHSLLRNNEYRFQYYKLIRRQPLALSEAFQYYIDAVRETTGLDVLPRYMIEEQIGCHYLYHPDIFFEMLEFHKLKGVIYE